MTTTGTRNILLTGRGGSNAGSFRIGIAAQGTSSIQSTSSVGGAGTITLNGVGGAATDTNFGVIIDNSMVESAVGDIDITAVGGNSPGSLNRGFRLGAGSQVNSTVSASITIDGTSDGGGTQGIQIDNSSINTVNRPIMLTGNTDVGAGLVVELGGQVNSTGNNASATITLIGNSTGTNDGVRIANGDDFGKFGRRRHSDHGDFREQ